MKFSIHQLFFKIVPFYSPHILHVQFQVRKEGCQSCGFTSDLWCFYKCWKSRHPGVKVHPHWCTKNHSRSTRLMESISGVSGEKELNENGTPVEILEGDKDNTMISSLRSELGINMKKCLDKNHVVKNIGKQLYCKI